MKKTVMMVFLVIGVSVMAQNSERQKYYFEKRMKEVKSRISLTNSKEKELSNTYDELCRTQPDEEAEWIFKIAMCKVVNDSSKIIAVCRDEISKAANARLPYNLEKIRLQKQLSVDQVKLLEPLVLERDKAFRSLDYLYPDNVDERVKAENRINEIFNKKMELCYIRLGHSSWLLNYMTALKYFKELSLTDEQIDGLGNLAWTLYRMLPTNADYKNRHFIEFNKTKLILTKEQFDSYINYKVKDSDAADPQKLKIDLDIIKFQKHLNDEQIKSLESSVLNKRFAKKKIEYTYPDLTSVERKNADILANEQFDKELNKTYLRMGVSSSLVNNTNALKYAKELSLSDKQIDGLVELACSLNKALPSSQNYKSKQLSEFQKTKEILTKEQLEVYIDFRVKNSDATDAQMVKKDLDFIKYQKQLTDEQAKIIEPLLIERRIAKKKIELSYLTDEVRKKADLLNYERYDKAFNLAYTKMGVNNLLMVEASALKFAKELNLNLNQIDELSSLGWRLAKELPAKLGTKERNMIEQKRTKEILNKLQYDKFIECRVKKNVLVDVQNCWSDIKKYNISSEIDSVSACNVILPYYNERAIINERYKYIESGEKEKQIQLENLNSIKPAILKKLSAVKNREKKKTALQPNALIW